MYSKIGVKLVVQLGCTSHTPVVCRSHCFPFSCSFVKKFPHTFEEFVCLGNRNRLDYLEIGGKNSMFPFRLSSKVQTSYKYVVCVTIYGPRVHLWEILVILDALEGIYGP